MSTDCTENQKLANGDDPDNQPTDAYDAQHGTYQGQKPQLKQAPSTDPPSPFLVGGE